AVPLLAGAREALERPRLLAPEAERPEHPFEFRRCCPGERVPRRVVPEEFRVDLRHLGGGRALEQDLRHGDLVRRAAWLAPGEAATEALEPAQEPLAQPVDAGRRPCHEFTGDSSASLPEAASAVCSLVIAAPCSPITADPSRIRISDTS